MNPMLRICGSRYSVYTNTQVFLPPQNLHCSLFKAAVQLTVSSVIQVAQVVSQRQQRHPFLTLEQQFVQKGLLGRRHVAVDQSLAEAFLSEVFADLFSLSSGHSVEVQSHEVLEDSLLPTALRAKVGLLESTAKSIKDRRHPVIFAGVKSE